MKTEPQTPQKAAPRTFSWKDRETYKPPPATPERPKADNFLAVKSKGLSC